MVKSASADQAGPGPRAATHTVSRLYQKGLTRNGSDLLWMDLAGSIFPLSPDFPARAVVSRGPKVEGRATLLEGREVRPGLRSRALRLGRKDWREEEGGRKTCFCSVNFQRTDCPHLSICPGHSDTGLSLERVDQCLCTLLQPPFCSHKTEFAIVPPTGHVFSYSLHMLFPLPEPLFHSLHLASALWSFMSQLPLDMGVSLCCSPSHTVLCGQPPAS